MAPDRGMTIMWFNNQKNLDEAFELSQEIENICQQYVIALKIGKPKILSFEEMQRVLNKAKNYKRG